MLEWTMRRGQIKHLLYEHCLNGRIDKQLLMEQFNDLNNVEPVKHGRWLKTGQSFVFSEKFRNYFCSECLSELDKKSIRTEFRYCPYCGAKMDLDEV